MRIERFFQIITSGAVLIMGTVLPEVSIAETTLPKIASLDYCSDQYVLALAKRSQVTALSIHATTDFSFYADRAKGLPQTSDSIENLIHLKPDVVVRYWGGNARMRSILKRTNIQIISADTGLNVQSVLDNVTIFSKAFDRVPQGIAFNQNYQDRVARLSTDHGKGLRAIYLSQNGTTAGKGTFPDEVITMAGLTNAISEMGIKGWRTLPLESLILNPPDIIIGSFFESSDLNKSNWGVIRHGVIQRMFKTIPTIFVPGRLFACRTFSFIDAAEYVIANLQHMNLKPIPGGTKP